MADPNGRGSLTALTGELPFSREDRVSRMGACAPNPIYEAGGARSRVAARRRDPKHHFASVIDYCHNIVEHMAYVVDLDNYSSQKFPRKPEFPR